MEEFPSNNHLGPKSAKAPSEEPKKKVERVVKGEVIQRKKSPWKRFKELFVSSGAKTGA